MLIRACVAGAPLYGADPGGAKRCAPLGPDPSGESRVTQAGCENLLNKETPAIITGMAPTLFQKPTQMPPLKACPGATGWAGNVTILGLVGTTSARSSRNQRFLLSSSIIGVIRNFWILGKEGG